MDRIIEIFRRKARPRQHLVKAMRRPGNARRLYYARDLGVMEFNGTLGRTLQIRRGWKYPTE